MIASALFVHPRAAEEFEFADQISLRASRLASLRFLDASPRAGKLVTDVGVDQTDRWHFCSRAEFCYGLRHLARILNIVGISASHQNGLIDVLNPYVGLDGASWVGIASAIM